MRVVGWQELCDAVAGVERATEWPHYAIFVYLAQYDAIMIGRRDRFLHGDLFGFLHRDWKQRGHPDVELEDKQVWMGHIEWDDDGSLLVRTESGTRLEREIELEIVALIEMARRKIQ